MRKKFIFILLLSLGLFFGCSQSTEITDLDGRIEPNALNEKEQMTITVCTPKTAATIPILRIIETNALGDEIKIELKLFDDIGKMMAIAASGDYELLTSPVHTAATLYNRGLDIKLLNISVWGGMYFSTTDSNCNNWEDIKGKKLYVVSKGSIPDILTQHFLKQKGLKIGENVELVYSTYPEMSQLIKMGKVKYAVDGEPFAASNKANIKDYRIIFNYVDEWKKTQGNEYSLPAYSTVANNNFLLENEELVKAFNIEYKKALKWTVDNPAKASELAKKHLNLNSEIIEKAIPNFNFHYKESVDAKKDIEKYFSILLNFKPESVGEKIPDDSFYYKN